MILIRYIAIGLLLTLFTGGDLQAFQKKKKKKNQEKTQTEDTSLLQDKTFAGLELRGIGPGLMSGRIADIAIHPHKQSTWYIAVGSGGVWKTTNAGTTWKSIFDGQGSYSIGCITLDPGNPEIVWVGSGENVGGRHVGYGDGVYRSINGGAAWEKMGLEKSEHIDRIIIHPENSNIIYVASQGPLWSKGGERGVYKSEDGGKNWSKILGEGDYTGCNDLVMDPNNPDILYAATHDRIRNVAALVNGGPGTAIYKTTDGGKNWLKLIKGLPKEDMGAIGLAISPQNSNVIYATIELAHRKGGFYRSNDGGGSWKKMNDYLSGGTGPHYYQEIFASPHKEGLVYQMDWDFKYTDDGGKTFKEISEKFKHGDNHAMAFDPDDPNYLMVGSDGGLYESWDHGVSWKFISNLPVTQFYKVAVDYDEPFYNVYGGTQDNNSQGGPSRTDNVHGIRNSDWFITLFGDGHQSAVDYSNPDIVYAEWQQGNLVRYDRKTGEIVYIKPQPGPGEPDERYNWDAPILISPHDPKVLYFASQRVWKSEDRGDSWTAISNDLSRNEDRLKIPMMDRVQSFDAVWDLWAMSMFANVTSLSESPLEKGLLYAGTDDGLIQVSENGGGDWRRIEVKSLPGVPERAFVNDIKADLHDVNTVYVALDNHKYGDFKPYIYKSTDRGKTWKSIASNLPERHLVWRVVQDHEQASLMFAGTEFGVFFTLDGGGKWIKLTGKAPTISFRDLVIQKRENDLVGATFGRGFWILDDYSPLRGLDEKKLEQEGILFPVRDAWWYIQRRTLGNSQKASQGDAFFTAPNPPFGAVFTYYLKDDLRGKKETRTEAEKELIKAGKDTPYPGWDALHEEAREDKPAIVMVVEDSDGNLVRQVTGEAKKGFHRIAWDLRYASTQAWRRTTGDNNGNTSGWLAGPGTYQVTMYKRVDGQLTKLSEPQRFEVKPMTEGTLPGQSHDQVAGFWRKLEETQRRVSSSGAVLTSLTERVDAIVKVLDRGLADDELRSAAWALKNELKDLGFSLNGDPLKDLANTPTTSSINTRLYHASLGNQFSTYGPTASHRRSMEILEADLAKVNEALNRINDATLPELEKKLEAAGVPWTPGRKLIP